MTQNISSHDQNILDRIINQSVSRHQKTTTSPRKSHACSELETKAIQMAEMGDLNSALQLINDCINQHPNIPSLYNNRAQIYRLLKLNSKAESDLCKCLQIIDDDDEMIKRLAHEQLGWILFVKGLNEEAQNQFELAALLGSEDAEKMRVRCNPFSELCNAMFRQAMQENKFSNP